MNIFIVICIILIISFIWALFSLRELHVPKEVEEVIDRLNNQRQKMWGVFLFVGNRIIHYSSESSAGSGKAPSSSPAGASRRADSEDDSIREEKVG